MKKVFLNSTHPRVQAPRIQRCELHVTPKEGGHKFVFPSDEDGNVNSSELIGFQLENYKQFKANPAMYKESELVVRSVIAAVQDAYNRKF